jgi:DNA mismatch endonuclease (patch repair protein)
VTDVHTPEQRSFNMSRIAGRDTKPELTVRRLLHAAGFRYRLHVKELPGKPDLVFPAARVVVFVHGCFWHMHKCKYGKPVPASNSDFWSQKRAGNVARDQRNNSALRSAGWRVVEIWECQTRDPAKLRPRLEKLSELLRLSASERP